jgi:hypothetical protein
MQVGGEYVGYDNIELRSHPLTVRRSGFHPDNASSILAEITIHIERFIMSNKEYDKLAITDALTALINKGLVEEIIVDGESQYRLTSIGEKVADHLGSDSKDRS